MPLESSQSIQAAKSPIESAAANSHESSSLASASHAASQKLGQEALTKSKVEPLDQPKLFAEGIASGLALNPINGLTQFANKFVGTDFKPIRLGNQNEIDSSLSGNAGKMIGTSVAFIALALVTKRATPLSSKILGSAARSESVAFGTAGFIQGGLLTPTQKDLSGSSFFLDRGGEACLGGLSAVVGAQGTRVAKLFHASAPSLGVTGARLSAVGAEAAFNGALGAVTAHAYSYIQTGRFASNQEVATSAMLSTGIGLGASVLSFHKGAGAVDSASERALKSTPETTLGSTSETISKSATAGLKSHDQIPARSSLTPPEFAQISEHAQGHNNGRTQGRPPWQSELYLDRHVPVPAGTHFVSPDPLNEVGRGKLTNPNQLDDITQQSGERQSDRHIGKVAEVVPIAQLANEMETLPDAYSFKQQLGNRSVGTLPEELLKGGLSQAAVFKKLDDLAIVLRSVDCNLPAVKKKGLGAADLFLPKFKIQLGDTMIGVKRIGEGETANVYALSADGKYFAFKVVHDPARIDVHGSYSEAGALTFLSKYPICDLVKFHASNPGISGGWLLNEYVEMSSNKAGIGLNDVLYKNGLRHGDDHSANRGPVGTYWDLGGIEPNKLKERPNSLGEFRDLLNSSESGRIAGRRMDKINAAEMKEALMLALDYPQVTGQVAGSAARLLKDKGELADVLRKALNTPGAAGRAAFELDYLMDTPHIKELYYEALKNPESRIEAAKQIDRLEPQDRRQAIDAAFEYPECRSMAARAIASLPEGADKTNAMRMAEQDLSAQITLRAVQERRKYIEHSVVSDWLTELVSIGLGR